MRKIILFVLLISFMLLMPEYRAQLAVGVSPPILDLGEIEPGTSKIARFYLVTSSEEKFIVYMTPTKDDISTFMTTKYKDFVYNYSEEDIGSWVEFLSNPVELEKPQEGQTTKAGVPIVGAREIIFILKVPKNAEPGYHSGIINLNPTGSHEAPSMITIKAVVPLKFIFKVPGKAIREGKILEISSGNYESDNRLNVIIYFQNTGTVTMGVGPAVVNIFDERGLLDSLSSNFDYVKPGKIATFSGFWFPKDIKLGRYNATAKIDYFTGSVSKQSFIDVYERPTPPVGKVVEKEFVFPWWMIALLFIVVVIIALIYYYKS
jgi:hypothetical protein